MKRHLVLVSESEFQDIISGEEEYLVRFLKKRLEFLEQLKCGDLVFLKRGREVAAQFNVGKVVLIEELEEGDFEILKKFSKGFERSKFEEKLNENRLLLIIRIDKFEQFITSPIEIDKKSKKEWVVLE